MQVFHTGVWPFWCSFYSTILFLWCGRIVQIGHLHNWISRQRARIACDSRMVHRLPWIQYKPSLHLYKHLCERVYTCSYEQLCCYVGRYTDCTLAEQHTYITVWVCSSTICAPSFTDCTLVECNVWTPMLPPCPLLHHTKTLCWSGNVRTWVVCLTQCISSSCF